MVWVDLISAFTEYTKHRNSPELFRKWGAIGMIGGAVERRVWTKIGQDRLFPNLWCLLVGPPGVGKTQTISKVEDFLYKTKTLALAPSNMNSASMLDALNNAQRTIQGGARVAEEYHALFIAAREFGVFLPEYDRTFMQILNDIFDCPIKTSVQRISRSKDEFIITNPMLNIIAGTTPSFLGEFMPEAAWSGGFTARFLMIYCNTGPKVELFTSHIEDKSLEDIILVQLNRLSTSYGFCKWEVGAVQEFKRWYLSGMEPTPQHSKLEHYLTRRHMLLAKLAMICALSRSGNLIITIEDLDRAKDLLFEAEITIPDIFRDMVGKSDGAVIKELHFFMTKVYISQPSHAKRPIPSASVFRFLKDRIPSEKVEKVLEIAIKSDVIAETGGGYIPRPITGNWNVDG